MGQSEIPFHTRQNVALFSKPKDAPELVEEIRKEKLFKDLNLDVLGQLHEHQLFNFGLDALISVVLPFVLEKFEDLFFKTIWQFDPIIEPPQQVDELIEIFIVYPITVDIRDFVEHEHELSINVGIDENTEKHNEGTRETLKSTDWIVVSEPNG